ncbi:chemotaxis protein CheW [Waterburya agarophytonicola K14]|uniref:Chemotaxis protein CheW n=1 Tax=Waterburya agarophytonicola KI4 TaxID=2874699 RepID=A0A964BQ24_9CYAN|nr:chemotaxis protein CheW [Waterburya agarophytonicola]MCC0177498.1 chemotaxis protein CheW [Waterburya agarophytonicola KI4]
MTNNNTTADSAASRVQADLQGLFKSNLAPGKAYIKFQLTSEVAAFLSMDQVQESMIVETEQVTTLPGMPKSTIGMISSRDRVFCVFDLAQLLNLSSNLVNPRQYQIIVLQTTDEMPIYLGLAVSNLQGIVRFQAKEIQPATATVYSAIAPFISGVITKQTTSFPILKLEYILQTIREIS